jgi:hypothetical protein
VANWQRSEDGQKGRNKPKPVPRPGVSDPSTTRYGDVRNRDQAKVRAFLDARAPLRPPYVAVVGLAPTVAGVGAVVPLPAT